MPKRIPNPGLFFIAIVTTVLCATILLGIAAAGNRVANEPRGFVSGKPLKCKYSVRDVGFVNVHSFSWQLTLVKPSKIESAKFDLLEQRVRQALKQTNLNHLWVSPDSKEWNELKQSLKGEVNLTKDLIGVLTNSNGDSYEVTPQSESESQDLEERFSVVESLVDSPFRQQVLEACSKALCSVVLVESGDSELNKRGHDLLNEAVGRIGKQMWELEKPTDKPPLGLVLKFNEQANESWLLNSLGVTKIDRARTNKAAPDEPLFAILYGQGRRLGELIPLSKANVEKLVGRAAVCGGDCECELDRDWLYGHQIIFHWSNELEQKAESTLDFDHKAAFVKSEVAAIVRKASRGGAKKPLVDLGPGLIIHDLEPIERKSENAKGNSEKATALANEHSEVAKKSSVASGRQQNADSEPKEQTAAKSRNTADEELPPKERGIQLPISLILVLLAIVISTVVWTMTKGGS